MARNTTIELDCDVTGLPNAETRIFAVNDTWYAIDLAGPALERWDEVIAEYLQYARRIGSVGRAEPQQALAVEGARGVVRRRARYGPRVDPKLVRPWWADNKDKVKAETGYEYRKGGIIPGAVDQMYLAHTAG